MLSGTGKQFQRLLVAFQSFEADPVDGIVQYWASQEGLNSYAASPKDARVLVQDTKGNVGWVVVQDSFKTSNGPVAVIIVREVHWDEAAGVATVLTFTTTGADFATTMATGQAGIEADGESPFAIINIDEIVGLIK